MGSELIHGLTALGNWHDIAFLFGGALIGMFVGVIPGLSTAVVLSIMLVFVYHIDVSGTLSLFLGAYAGSYYAASVTAILLNTPAHPEAFAVTFDGFTMARKGEPARALGISACSTCFGGLIGCAVLLGFYQIMNSIPLVFHPPEYAAIVLLALLLVGTLGTNSVPKAIIAAGIGLMIASIGSATIAGVPRYTFGAVGLLGGVSLVALTLGVFAIVQMVMVFGTGAVMARQDLTGMEISGELEAVSLPKGFRRELMGGVFETFRYWTHVVQGGVVGALMGIVPGIGGFAANFIAYGVSRQTAKRRRLFGTGIPEGIIAPEAASLAKEAGSMVPILGLGIPGSVGGALFLGALSIKQVLPGYGFIRTYPTISYEIVWIIALTGIIGTAFGVLVGPQLARITRIPGPLIVPFIFALSVIGTYAVNVQFFAVMEVLVFGILGLGLRRLGYPLGAFLIGLILGPTFELGVYQTHEIYPGFSFIAHRPLADAILAMAIGILVLRAAQIRHTKRQIRAERELYLAQTEDLVARRQLIRLDRLSRFPYPLLAVIMSAFLAAVSLYVIVYGLQNYNFVVGGLPVIAGLLVAVPVAFLLPADIYHYVLYRRSLGTLASDERAVLETPELLGIAERGADELKELTGVGVGGAGERRELTGVSVSGAGVVGDVRVDVAISYGGAGRAGRISSALARTWAPIVDKSWGRNGQYRREFYGFVWFGLLILLCWLFGFMWGSPMFTFAYGVCCTRRHFRAWKQQASFIAVSTATVWLAVTEIYKLTHLVFIPKITL